jgi:antitoxin component of RelBE/YafQ-DinJ toxin-antitoxin module
MAEKLKETQFMFKIDKDLKEKVRQKAYSEDLTMSQLIRRLLLAYVNEKQSTLNF